MGSCGSNPYASEISFVTLTGIPFFVSISTHTEFAYAIRSPSLLFMDYFQDCSVFHSEAVNLGVEELYPLVMEPEELANVGLKNRRHQL